ncbi:MAG: hypothetical protein E6K64_11985 [Nitrospirae bacterium]|nr:MAG: hypothetical protein E6K64_11985 [Nitrospirota bacterium]
MIDREARNKLTELLRRLVSGQITNYQFGDSFPLNTRDEACWAVRDQAWMLYDDLSEHRLVGRNAVSKPNKRIVARSILFLYSDLEYEWPVHPCVGLKRLIAAIFTFGILPRHFDRKWQAAGEFHVWPFICQNDFEESNNNPKLLRGNGS